MAKRKLPSQRMTAFLFVGERPSPRARAMRVTWEDGRLCAANLHDALRAAGVDPGVQHYDNLFHPTDPLRVNRAALRRVRRACRDGWTVVALGRQVQHLLTLHRIEHLAMIHPAARGRIRLRRRYREHVRATLGRKFCAGAKFDSS